MKAATETLDRTVVERPLKNQNLYLDKGYDYPEIERESIKRRYVPHIRQRSRKRMDKDRVCNEEIGCRRTNSWHNRFRKLLIRYDKKSANYLVLVQLLSCLILYRRDNFGIGSNIII